MKDYTKLLPLHVTKTIGEHDLYLEVFEGEGGAEKVGKRPPLLFVHGAYTGSWMWSKYLPHFIGEGWKCYVMNMRSHYKSRVMDMTKISFEDYLEDVKENIKLVNAECQSAPIIIGFSLGGILSQKVAEAEELSGLILIDSSISKEVNIIAPYESLAEDTYGIIIPAPVREANSIDESEEDIAFQKKYLSMESSVVLKACSCWIKGGKGISINRELITCKTLVIKAVNNEEDDKRGQVEADYLKAEYSGFRNTTHTGLLVGQRYVEIVNRIIGWLNHELVQRI